MIGRVSEPRSAERAYTRALLRVHRQVYAVIVAAIEPLIRVWPEPRGDVRDPTDSEFRALWSSLDPDDVRRYAPWATSRGAVERVLTTAGRPIAGVDLEDYVRASMRSARVADPGGGSGMRPLEGDLVRPPGAFRIRPGGVTLPDPPAILGPSGLPVHPPPVPHAVTSTSISEQFGWARIRVGEMTRAERLSPILDTAGKAVNRHVVRDLGSVLRINLRESIPGIQPLIDGWRGANVGLIESGVLGPMDGVSLRPLLDDVGDMVEHAHAQGLRVEELAGELQRRFEISDRRAELIARDQTLKLNGQINQNRQRAAGITQYAWRAVGDERTRPMHADLDGTIHSWDAPPVVSEDGRMEHPGGDYQCRCGADPVTPEWMDA